MSIFYRNKNKANAEQYFSELYEKNGCIPENHLAAIRYRMQYFDNYILKRAARDYITVVERDWAYIARREYRYDVNIRSACDGFAAGLTACMVRMYMVKRSVFWPLAPVFLVTYLYRANSLFVFHNKKYFDMCNVGEQYEIGYARNVILRRCNRILDREDF